MWISQLSCDVQTCKPIVKTYMYMYMHYMYAHFKSLIHSLSHKHTHIHTDLCPLHLSLRSCRLS